MRSTTGVLAIDLGTSGVKVAVVDEGAEVLASARTGLATTFLPDGGAEQDADAWWDAIGTCAREIVADHRGDIAAVVVTSQYMSVVAIDGGGRPVAPVVMWMDQRGLRHVEVPPGDGDLVLWLDRHGMFPAFGDPAHIAFLRAERPEAYESAAALLEPVDALNARLTGRICATQTTAMPLMTVDNRTLGATAHDPDLVARSGLDPAKLPPLIAHDDVVGALTPEAAAHLGLSTDVVVLPGTIDSVTSGIGCGVVDASMAALVLGTTAVVVTAVDRKTADYDHDLVAVPSPVADRWYVLAENGTGGRALEVGLHLLGLGFADAEALAATAPAGSGGVVFQPWLSGTIAPVSAGNVRGGLAGIGLGTTRNDVVRSLYEGVAGNAAWLLPHVAALAGSTWSSIRLGGGGATSVLWAQIVADVLGVTVERVGDPRNANARGAALLAHAHPHIGTVEVASIPDLVPVEGRHEPDPSTRAVHDRLVVELADLHAAVRPVYDARAGGVRPG
jgi:xylulokinase